MSLFDAPNFHLRVVCKINKRHGVRKGRGKRRLLPVI